MFLTRDEEVVAIFLDFDAQTSEGIGDDAEIRERDVLDVYAVATHGRHTDKRAHFNHVGQQAVVGTMQRADANDGEQVAADACDVGSHAVKHVAELLDVGFAGCIIDGGSPLGEYGSHNNVGRTSDRSLVEQHIGTC